MLLTNFKQNSSYKRKSELGSKLMMLCREQELFIFDLLCVLSVSCYWKKILLLLMFTRVLCCPKQPSVPLGQHVMTQLNQSICLKLYTIALLLCFCTFGTTQQKSGIKLLLTLIILILYVHAYYNVNKKLKIELFFKFPS